MSGHEYEIGLNKLELDTPALLLDVESMEKNLHVMASYFDGKETKLRPHVKLHKATPILSHMQLEAGNAIGLTCAKLSEAETLVASGIKDILIANQIVGDRKITRLMNLAAYSDVKVAVDTIENVQQLSMAASARDIELGVVVEVNIGHNRCGVAPGDPALNFAKEVVKSKGLVFRGIMGYDGHCTRQAHPSKREKMSIEANRLLVETKKHIEAAGIDVEIVSGSGSYTYKYASQVPGITEIQAGTYLLMDTSFSEAGVTEFFPALSVLGTVTSRPTYPGAENMAVMDIGRKAYVQRDGSPKIKFPDGVEIIGLSQEHGRVRLTNEGLNLSVGDKLEIWVWDANVTINFYDKFYAIRNEIVEGVWDIPARGLAT